MLKSDTLEKICQVQKLQKVIKYHLYVVLYSK